MSGQHIEMKRMDFDRELEMIKNEQLTIQRVFAEILCL